MERRKFTREFKIEAVKLIQERGVSVAQAARDLGVQGSVLRRWVQESVADAAQAFPGQGQMKPEQAELARLRREVLKLKAERDILKKAAAGSRRRHCEIRLHRDPPRNLADGMVMRGARGLAGRLLCLADPIAECPGEGQRTAAEQGTIQLPGQRPHLWRTACLARSPGRRGLLRSTSDRAADATGGVARPPQTAADAVGYRDPVDERRRAECARPHIHGRVGQPQMGRRLHLPLDRRRLALRRGGGGSVLTPGRRLVDAGDDDHATGHGRPHDGDLAARQAGGGPASLGSGEPVHQ